MSIKLTLLKSGETLISDLKEVVADVNQDKPTAFILENPHLVDTKKKDGGKFDVILSPWYYQKIHLWLFLQTGL